MEISYAISISEVILIILNIVLIIVEIGLIIAFIYFYGGLLKSTSASADAAKRTLAITFASKIKITEKKISSVSSTGKNYAGQIFHLTANLPTRVIGVESVLEPNIKKNYHSGFPKIITDEIPGEIFICFDMGNFLPHHIISINVIYEDAGSGNEMSKEFLFEFTIKNGDLSSRKMEREELSVRGFDEIDNNPENCF